MDYSFADNAVEHDSQLVSGCYLPFVGTTNVPCSVVGCNLSVVERYFLIGDAHYFLFVGYCFLTVGGYYSASAGGRYKALVDMLAAVVHLTATAAVTGISL